MSKSYNKLSLPDRMRRIVSSGRHWDEAAECMLKAADEIEGLAKMLVEQTDAHYRLSQKDKAPSRESTEGLDGLDRKD